MKKYAALAIGILVVVVIVFAAWYAWGSGSAFYAVYLKTGDLYFGKLIRFPYFGLEQVYTLQVQQNPQTPLSIQRFKNVFWGPEDTLRINRDEVIWVTKLNPKGQLAELFKTNPDLIPPQGASSQPQGYQVPNSQQQPLQGVIPPVTPKSSEKSSEAPTSGE